MTYLLALAAAVEFVIERIKSIIPDQFKEKLPTKILWPTLSVIMSVTVCIFYGIDIFQITNITSTNSLFGEITAGFAAAFGTDTLHQAVKLISKNKNDDNTK